MASYTGSPASGKQGDIVYSRNRYGQYTRILRIPVNPKSAKQSQIRARFTTLSQQWRDLTVNQRTAWRSYAETNPVYSPKINGFVELSGNSMFVKINQQRLQVGIAIATVPPGNPSFVSTSVSVFADVNGNVLTVSGTDQPAGYRANIFVSPCLSPGISFPPRLVKVAQIDAGGWSTPVSIFTGWQTNWGFLIEGQRLFVDAQLASDEGVYGARIRVSTTIVDTTV